MKGECLKKEDVKKEMEAIREKKKPRVIIEEEKKRNFKDRIAASQGRMRGKSSEIEEELEEVRLKAYVADTQSDTEFFTTYHPIFISEKLTHISK